MRRPRKYSGLQQRILALLLVMVLPLTGIVLGILGVIADYTSSYRKLMDNMEVANAYNLTFKEDMEYSMYRVMIGLIDTDQFQNGDIIEGQTQYANIIKNPFTMIQNMRSDFSGEIKVERGSYSYSKVKGILFCLDSLETAVDKMIDNSKLSGTYQENTLIWENDIKGLCTMIQTYLDQYIYYELINMEALQKTLESNMQGMMGGFLVLLILVLTVGSGLSIFISRSVTTPVHRLSEAAERFGRGELDARAAPAKLEELNVLVRTYNQMSDKIRSLVDKNRQEQRSLREAEIKLLQAQINPHFLYNTLDSIVWMAESGNNRQVVEMTTDLSDFFRTVLSGGKDFISIGEEEKHIDSYLRIQKIRYEDIMDYRIEMEEDIQGEKVLKMLLQPLVENALYHGIKNKRGGGRITVRGYREKTRIVFEVEDDGIGMDRDILQALNREMQPEDRNETDGSRGGFGLRNVRQRLRMYYGEDAEFLVESEPGEGTLIKILLDPRAASESIEK